MVEIHVQNRYNSNKAHQSEFNTVNMRASMEKLLVDNKVAVVFNGHVHAYERSVPVAFNATTAKAPTYVDFATKTRLLLLWVLAYVFGLAPPGWFFRVQLTCKRHSGVSTQVHCYR